MYDTFKDEETGILTEEGIQEIFKTTVDPIPWQIRNEVKTVEDKNGLIGVDQYQFNSWVGLWQKYFSYDYQEAFKSLVYLGFCESFEDSSKIRNHRIGSLLKEVKRNVFNVYVVGNSNVGKSEFIRKATQISEYNDREEVKGEEEIVTAVCTMTDFINKFVVFTEIPADLFEKILKDKEKIRKCDCIVLLHDGTSSSANYLLENFKQTWVPTVLLQTKVDDHSI